MNNGKVLIISQPAGLGDIIFCQTIANDFIGEGYKVLWPVIPDLVVGVNRAYPNVVFVNRGEIPVNLECRERYERNDVLYLPTRYSEFLMGKPYKFHMESKYSYLGKDWQTWKRNAIPVRHLKKEELLKNFLGINANEPYNFIATQFGALAQHKAEIKISNQYKNVELNYVPGFSLFDWCGVIEGAETIHAVSSSTLYLFEILNLKASEVHIYNRTGVEQNLDYVRFLFSRPYILHE